MEWGGRYYGALMNIEVKGKGMDVGDALRGHITNALSEHLTHYFERSLDAHVTVSKQNSAFTVDMTAHVPGEILAASGEAEDAYAAYDMAQAKLLTQVKKYKSKLTDHHKDEVPSKVISA